MRDCSVSFRLAVCIEVKAASYLVKTYMSERELVVTTVGRPRRVVGVDTGRSTSILSSSTETLLLGREVAEVEHRPCGGLGGRVVTVSHVVS